MTSTPHSSQTIDMSNALLLGHGSHRCCYRHLHETNRCIKLSKSVMADPPTKRKRKPPGVFTRLRRLAGLRWRSIDEANALELEAYKRLQAIGLGDHFAHCFGFVNTSLGQGLLCELVCSPDGSPAPSLRDYIGQHGPLPPSHPIRQAVEQFLNMLADHRAYLSDVNIANLVITRPDATHPADVGIICIDGKSFVHTNGLAALVRIPWIARAKFLRRNARLLERITQKNG